MKRIISISIFLFAICGVLNTYSQPVYTFTPKSIFDFWVSRTTNFDPEVSTGLNTGGNGSASNGNPGNGSNYVPSTGRVDVRSASTGTSGNVMYSGVSLSFVHNNANAYLFSRHDSIFLQATDAQGVNIAFTANANNVAGRYRIIFEYSATNDNGRHIVISCNSDTVRDIQNLGRPHHRFVAYNIQGTGARTVQFRNRKLDPWPSGGNINFFGAYIFNIGEGDGYLLNTFCEHINGGRIIKEPSKVAYKVGDVVKLTAVMNPGYAWSGWDDGEEEMERTVTIEAVDRNLTALFTAVDYGFTAKASPEAGGIVTINPVKARYNVGDRIELTATASSTAYEFVDWSDGETTPTRTFTMPAYDVDLLANFKSLIPRSITISASPTNGGTITVTPRETPATPNVYFDTDVIDLLAIPNSGYEFVRWSDGTDDPEYAVRFNGSDINLTAEFRTSTGNPPTPSVLPKPVVRVDFNISGRVEKEVNEPRYTPWVVGQGNLSNTFGDVTVSLAHVGDVGTGLRTGWHKTTLQAPYFARLVADGIMVDGGENGGQIAMTFRGLRKGTHHLLLYLNAWDNNTNTYAPFDIFIDEVFKERVQPTNRVFNNADAAISYLEFQARDYQDVVVRIAAVTTGDETIKNVYLNAFELNVPNIKKQARYPFPADMDEHVDADNGSVLLRWQKALEGTQAHDIYFGTDSAEVATADKQSAVFKGTQAANDTTFLVNDIYNMDTYYWRIDEVKDEVTTQGNVWYFRPRVLAFRGAEGYGKYARGARGGKVVYVTNLNNDGPGSLRDAIKNVTGPRYVLFAVGGRIDLEPGERLTLTDHYVTVAGQTAPGKGVCVTKASFGISGAKDAIMRFMRVRVGQWGITIDGMGMNDANYSIMDHNSMSWTLDEAFSSRNGKNFTLQRTHISEALNVAGHKNYSYGSGHGYAATIGGDTASFLGNLLAHCEGRNWSLGGGLDGDGYYAGHLDITNNVVYNYGGRVTDGGAHEVNFVNNFYKQGWSSTSGMLKAQHEGVGLGTQKYYARGNRLQLPNGTFQCDGSEIPASATAYPCGCSETWSGEEAERYDAYVDEPFFPHHANVLTARNAFKSVISDCGATMPVMDEHDLRVALEARDGTYKYRGSHTGREGRPDHHLDVGGFENYPEIILNLNEFDSDRDGLPNWYEIEISKTNPNSAIDDYSDTNFDPERDGHTNMERYLEFMSTPNFTTAKNRQVAIELGQYTLGYTLNPVYSVEVNGNGAVTIDGNWARFQPTLDFAGITYFEVKVTDSEGDSMVRRFAVRVTE
jgi:hypothetical protein